jgi:hypothetical protein
MNVMFYRIAATVLAFTAVTSATASADVQSSSVFMTCSGDAGQLVIRNTGIALKFVGTLELAGQAETRVLCSAPLRQKRRFPTVVLECSEYREKTAPITVRIERGGFAGPFVSAYVNQTDSESKSTKHLATLVCNKR